MKSLSTSGFTIIEVMLVLAISSLLAMGVVIGFSGSLNTQRYRDTVSSLQSLIQKQFSDVNSISNNNSTLDCIVSNSNPVLTNHGVYEFNGISGCVMLGKLITTTNGSKISTYNVIGADTSGLSFSGDVDALSKSNIILDLDNLDLNNDESYNLEWGASLKKTTGETAVFSVLIVRSPASGAIRTFINPGVGIDPSANSGYDVTLRKLVTDGNGINLQKELLVCVKSDGSIRSDKTAIFIKAGAASSSGVELQGELLSGC